MADDVKPGQPAPAAPAPAEPKPPPTVADQLKTLREQHGRGELKFASEAAPAGEGEGEGAAAGEGEGEAGAAGAGEGEGAGAAGDGEGAAGGEAAGEGEGGAAGEGEGEGEGKGKEGEGEGGEAPEAELTVPLPGRRPEDPPVEIVVEDKETADRLRQAIRGGIRREELHRERAELDGLVAEVARFEDELTADPVGFFMERVKPELRIELARHLISDEAVYTALIDEIAKWDKDPKDRQLAAAKLREKHAAKRSDVDRELAARERQRAEVRKINGFVDRLSNLVPDELIDTFRYDALGDISNYMRQQNVGTLRAEEIPTILASRLRLYGIETADATAAVSSDGRPQQARPPARSPGKRPASPAPGGKGAPAPAARSAGQRLVQARQKKQAAAAVPSGGAGAGVTKLVPPPNQTVKERVAWLREQIGATPK